MDIKNIALGIINETKKEFGSPDPKVEDLALKRMEVCLSCDLIEDSPIGKRCSICKCKLSWMSRSRKLCQAGKWDNVKWKMYSLTL